MELFSIEEARTFYSGADSAHDFDHVLRVAALADRIAQAEGADRQVVRMAALLHDIARLEEDQAGNEGRAPVDHAELAADRARELLVSKGATPEFAGQVADAIRAHRFRGSQGATSLEARVLFDADKLDALGAIGVARAYAVAGALNQRLYAEPEPNSAARRDQHNAEHSPVAEFAVKLSHLHDRLNTVSAKAIGAERHRFMTMFFERLEKEVKGDL